MSIPKQTKVWVTKEKQKIRLCDMRDSHLLNLRDFLICRAGVLQVNLLSRAYSFQSTLNGEIAIDAMDQEIRNLEEASSDEFLEEEFPIYRYLLLEIERRRLP